MYNIHYGGKKNNSKKSNEKINKKIKTNIDDINIDKKKGNENNNENKIKLTDREERPRNIYEKIEYKLEPIKILFQYKNNNKKTEYETYIFVGFIGNRYKEIFDKIKDLDIYETLKTISIDDEKKLSKGFGDFWITKFFNKYHISAFVNKIQNNKEIKNTILNKFEEEWLTKFINKFKSDIVFKKVNYSYADLVKFEYKIKMGKKLEKMQLEKEDVEELNFENSNSFKNKNILYEVSQEILKNQVGGEGEVEEEIIDDMIEDDNITDYDEDLFDINKDEETDNDVDIASGLQELDEELEYEEIEKIYQTDIVDKNFEVTSDMIAKVLNDDKIISNKDKFLVNFNIEKDDYIENDELSRVYKKNFVYSQYIFKDDSIKTIRNKITSAIANNPKFGKDNYIIPSRMYLWSEYLINNKIEKIALGQKWMKKNELLNYDIEPLSLNNYENLENNIKKLRDSMKRYAGKIRREDEEGNILYDYQNYILNDEIYMIDIYNELGKNYKGNSEKINNLIETYFKLYFPRIKQEDIKGIIEYLNDETNIESNRIKNTFETIFNDIIIEKEITDLVEIIKIDQSKEYYKLFSDGNFITQSVIHVNLDIKDEQTEQENIENINKLSNTGEFGTIILPKLDLFRIFNDFSPNDRYPFIQYQVPDGQIIFKYYDTYMYEFTKTKENVEMITKWFENSPYGISFKVKLNNNKFMAININDIGKIEYKTQWKEEDAANIYDIIDTYDFVKELVIKINETLLNHPRKISIRIPEDWEFRFAFINCIQKFKLPDNKIIDHNDLSEFCRFFFPFIALVIEPKKRLSKVTSKEEKSKYGSYLRYKRDSKFDNEGKIEQRILSYLRNVDFEDDILADEIAKQFNITSEKSKEEILKVRSKFPNISKNKKMMKKLEGVPKFKPPGIGIDIQGKIPEKYKIRISGAKDQKQLERIILFMNILIYLYSETYILKKPERQYIKDKLKKLINIAKRRSKVEDIIDYQKEVKTIKQMTQVDKKRLGFKPEEGQNQWSRSCQNSGNDKKRRPQQIQLKNISDLVKKGYNLNKKTGEYEKKVIFKNKNKKGDEIILKALKVVDSNEATNTVNELFYTCDPEENAEHMYVGFLTKSNNPFGECMPCCFKKNPLIAKKQEKQDFYKRCMGDKTIINQEKVSSSYTQGDILYILQDTNKIQDGRIGYLPKYIDFLTNYQFKKTKEIKNHYLLSTNGYFFKLGIKQEDYSFLNTLSTILNLTNNEIKEGIINFLKTDVNETHYFSLNDGDIRTEFRIGDFINFIRDSEFIDYYYLKDLLKISGLFTKKGIVTIIFNKITTILNSGVEKEKIKEDFIIDVDKTMVIDYEYSYNLLKEKDVLILIKEGKFYYPLVEVFKEDDNTKNITIKKLFSSEDKDNKLIDEIKKYFEKTINDINIDNIKTHTSARETYFILKEISKKNKEYEPLHQVIDSRYKCKFIITKNNTIIPTIPSGIVLELNTICLNTKEYSHKYSDCFSKVNFLDLEISNKNLEILFKLSNKKLNVKPIGVFYDNIDKKNDVNIIGIITSNNDLVPIKNLKINKKELDKNNVLYQNRPLYYELDQKLANYNKNDLLVIDDRIKNVNLNKYKNESYELFKFEISNFINSKNNLNYKQELKKLIDESNINKIQDFFLNISISKLNGKIINKNNIVGPELVKIIDDIPNIDYYKINNQRIICDKLDENKCSLNPHCVYHNSKCSFALTENNLFEFIRKLSTEIVEINIKAFEILREKKYFVSDIVDYNNFTEKPGQKIIKSTNTNLVKILVDLFGKEHVPKIGKRHYGKKNEIDIQQLQLENPLKDIKDAFTQTVIPYNYSILRAYSNGYYWNKHVLYDSDIRNLGYYSNLQNELINIFRSIIIDWLNLPSNIEYLCNLDENTKAIINNPILYLNENLNVNKDNVLIGTIDIQKRLIINKYIIGLIENNTETNYGLFELFILHKIHLIPLVILLNGVSKYYINNNSIIEINNKDEKTNYLIANNICINMEFNQNISYPFMIDVLYYKS
jgi:hypothetical protein